MESKDTSVDNGKCGILTIVPVSQTLDAQVDLCENVCPKNTIDSTTPVDDGGIMCDNPNVPNVPVEPVVTTLRSGPSGNGCSTGQLGAAVDGADQGSIKSDKSDGDAFKAMVMHENGCSGKPLGTLIDGDEFTVISQTLDDLCEKVCSNTTLHITSVDADGIKCHNINVPKGTYGAVEPMVTDSPGGNGCSAEQLSTAKDGAASDGIECDGSSDTGALKPMVTLTPRDSAVSLVTNTIKYSAVTSGIECDTITNTDTAVNENKTCLVDESGDYNHENNNHNEAIDESCCNSNKTTREDQPTSLHSKYYEDDIDSTRTGDDDDINKTSLPKDNLEESEEKSSISEECAAGTPVSMDNIVSELSELKHSTEHESSVQSCATDTHVNLAGIPITTANACDMVSQVQNANALNDHKNQNVPDAQMSKQRRKKKNRSNHQTPSSSKSSSLTPHRNVQVNDFEFVLSVVQQDLEEIQMLNETAKSTVSEEDMNEDNSDDDSDSSDTSSSSSTSDSSSSTEFNSKRSFAENLIEEDEDRVHVTSGPRTKDEMLLSELPPPLDVEVMANKDQIKQLGKIESIINAEAMVIIKSFPDVPALDSDSILFLDDGSGFGQVFDIFGQVRSPHYCVRFNNEDEIKGKNLSVGQTVFYAPNTESMTHFVFVSNLQRVKGSDASWKHDQEPPDELLEYSDDEAESAAKAAKKKANRSKNRNQTQTQEKDTAQENVKKPRTPNPATSQPPCKKQATHQQYQPRQSYQPPPPRPFNIRHRDQPTEFYGERFQLGQRLPMQFNPRSHPPRLGPQPMQRLPSGNFYHHQRPQQYYTQVPAGPAPPQFRSLRPPIPLDMHRMHGPPQHPPLELSLPPPQNAGQPVDQLWSPRVNSYPSGQPVDLGQFVARPRWPVHPPIPQAPDGRPPFYCPPR